MQTPINWIKYEGNTKSLLAGEYLIYGSCIRNGKIFKEMRVVELREEDAQDCGCTYWEREFLDSFIIEYIATLSEIERGIEEEVNKQKHD